MKTVFFLLLFTLSTTGFTQINDQFTDGDFTANPAWSGTAANYTVNAGNQLQLNNTIAATSYLSTPHGLSTLDNQEWHFWYSQTFASSTSNYGRFYLTSSSADLTTNPDGFCIQFGEAGSTDAVRLFKSVGGIPTQICASPDGQIASSFAVGIRVVRDAAGNWELYVDPTGGTNYGTPYTGMDATNLVGTHSGLLSVYTASNATKFYLDNLYAGDEIVDSTPPVLVSATAIDATHVDVLFDESVGGLAILQNSNYILDPGVAVQGVVHDGPELALMHLTLVTPLANGQTYNLTVGGAQDLAGNNASTQSTSFTYLVGETPIKGDLIISEFMADASPVIGLPELEFIEIYNRSNKYFDLTGWKIGDASSDGTITAGFIGPNEYKILCATSSQPDFPGSYAVTSFPGLNNSGDDIKLKAPDLTIVDKLSYTDGWYRDDVKAEGGYTIELINPNDPCSDATNWIASTNTNGGTPGIQNSVYNTTPDTQAPALILANALAPNFLEILFSEGMDSTSIMNASVTTVAPLTVSSIYVPNEFANSAIIAFSENLALSQTYQLSIQNIADCWLNSATLSGHFALSESPVIGDLVINEIFFDPAAGGSDFVELYNTSGKVINLKDLSLANFEDDTISNFHTIPFNYFLYPNDYVTITADSSYQENTFPAAVSGKFLQMSLPALNNDSGTVYLIYNAAILDEVSYSEDWHFSLLDNTENKTLERINPKGQSNSKDNWHTAAEAVGFGTPGKQNSQYQVVVSNGNFAANEPVFSPDNDGFQDVLLFNYSLSKPGLLATVTLYDDQGRVVKELFKSELMSVSGTFAWDGVNDQNFKAGIGIYLAVMEAFDIDGSQKFVKRIAFTLAGKVN